MANTKISALPASTTPLAGTEVLPIVQSSTTRQVSVANLTAGRAVATGALTVTGAATVSTTLGVTGAATLSSTLGVTGAATLSSTLGVTGAATLSSTLGVTGLTTLTSLTTSSTITDNGGTANGVTYLNGSKVLTSGSALTFDGTNFAVVGGNATINRSTNTSVLTMGGSPSANWEGDIRFLTSNTQINWRVSSNQVASGAFTITPSTAGGGSTFTTPAVLIDSSSNVGIGTTSPSEKLHIKNASGINTYLRAENTNGYALFGVDSSGNAYAGAETNDAFGLVTNGSYRLYIEAAGNVGIGTTSPSQRLDATVSSSTEGSGLAVTNSLTGGYGSGVTFYSLRSDTSAKLPAASVGVAGASSWSSNATTSSALLFSTVNANTFAERARITSDGNLLVGTTNTNPVGADINGFAVVAGGRTSISRLGGEVLGINRGTDDGILMSFAQAGSTEGNISVSGTTVSYNGGHLSRWAQMLTKPELFKGTVMSNLDEMNVYTKDGQPVDNEQLNKVKVSDTEGDVNVAGVFVNWSHDEDHNVDEINMAMTGDMIIRIAQGVTVVRGDLLMSAGDGTAKPQGDDIIRSKTVAKVTSNHVTCTYADGSYCVPCVLMAC